VNGKRLDLSLKTVTKGFSFLRVRESDSLRGDQGEEWGPSPPVWLSSIDAGLRQLGIRVIRVIPAANDDYFHTKCQTSDLSNGDQIHRVRRIFMYRLDERQGEES
jgi:hypothetical protein